MTSENVVCNFSLLHQTTNHQQPCSTSLRCCCCYFSKLSLFTYASKVGLIISMCKQRTVYAEEETKCQHVVQTEFLIIPNYCF